MHIINTFVAVLSTKDLLRFFPTSQKAFTAMLFTHKGLMGREELILNVLLEVAFMFLFVCFL